MEYSEVKNRVIKPFKTLVEAAEKNGYLSYEHRYIFGREFILLVDAKKMLRGFFKGLDQDIAQDCRNDLMTQIRRLIVALHELNAKHEYNDIAKDYISSYMEYLQEIRKELSTPGKEKPKQTKTLESETPLKDFKIKPEVNSDIVINHYNWLYSNNYTDSPEKDFKAIFSNDPLPDNWQPIRWIKLSEKGKTIGRPNITALAATIFELLDVKKSEKFAENLSYFFVDKDGNTIKPNLKINPDPDTLGQYLP